MLPTHLSHFELQIGWCNNTCQIQDDWENLVVFHHPCNDGFGAALMAWKHLNPKKTIFWPANYDQKSLPVEVWKGKKVFILDFSFPIPFLNDLIRECERVIWLDHHESAIVDYIGEYKIYEATTYNYTIKLHPYRSGALITAIHFESSENPPYFIECLSDRDLWKFQLDGSKELHAYLQTIPMDFFAWNNVLQEFEGQATRTSIIDTGHKLLLQYESNVKTHLSKVNVSEDANGNIYAQVNCSSVFSSDLGSLILTKFPNIHYAIMYNIVGNDVHVSLRSRKGGYNVAELAKRFGGGGHQSAAGYVVSIDTFFW